MVGKIDGDASSHTTSRMSGRNGGVQIVGRLSGRRSWSLEQKLRIIGEAFSPGSSVTQVSERHDVSTGQLYTWRKQLLDGELCGPGHAAPQFAQVEVASVAGPPNGSATLPAAEAAARPSAAAASHGNAGARHDFFKHDLFKHDLIEIELRSGARVRVGADVAMEALGRVLDMLERR